MKNILPSVLFLLMLGAFSSAQAQSTLWAGSTPWSGGSNNLYGYDTTGGVYTLATTLPLTSDFSASVQGVVGMALNPSNGIMYVVHQDGAGPASRRLGTVDLTTGDITDIGNVGNVSDLAFIGSTLYGAGGRQDGTAELYEIDVTDASSTIISNMSAPFSAVSIGTDYYNDQLWYFENGTSNCGTVDISPFAENLVGPSTAARAATMKDSDTFILGNGSNFFEYVISTGVSTLVGTAGGGEIFHSFAFDQYPLSALVNGPSTFCSNEPSEVYVNESGTSYQWHVDGTLIPTATDSTWIPTISGTYFCVLNGTDTTFTTQVIVLPAPGASFSMTPDPVSLGLDPTGTVDFTNTSIPNGHTFWWDFSGFNSTVENPSFPFPTAGSYGVTFIVYDTITGCSDTAMATVTVNDDLGITDLNSEIMIYPNPTEDIVFVTIMNGASDHNLQLMDLQGRIVSEQELVGGAEAKVSFDLTDYESGVYLLKVIEGDNEAFYKILKK